MKYLYGFIVLHCHCIMQRSIAIVIACINGEHVLVEEVREELVACEIDRMKGSLEWRLWMRIAGERDERVKASLSSSPSLFLPLLSLSLSMIFTCKLVSVIRCSPSLLYKILRPLLSSHSYSSLSPPSFAASMATTCALARPKEQ